MISTSEYDSALMTLHICVDDETNPEPLPCELCGEVIPSPPIDMSAHGETCPFTTGLWTIDESVQFYTCDGCGQEHAVHYACPRCDLFFEDGDPYRFVDDATGLVVPWVAAPGVATAICVECAQRQTDALMERMP